MAGSQENKSIEQGAVKSKAKKWILILSAAAVVLSIGAATGMHFTSQPQFCATCHEIKPKVISWGSAPHNSVNCIKCHADPGLIGYVKRKFAGLGELYLHSTNQIPNNIEARFNIETCKYCHMGNEEEFPNAKNITLKSGANAPRVPHDYFIKSNVSCLECHRNVGHGSSAD